MMDVGVDGSRRCVKSLPPVVARLRTTPLAVAVPPAAPTPTPAPVLAAAGPFCGGGDKGCASDMRCVYWSPESSFESLKSNSALLLWKARRACHNQA